MQWPCRTPDICGRYVQTWSHVSIAIRCTIVLVPAFVAMYQKATRKHLASVLAKIKSYHIAPWNNSSPRSIQHDANCTWKALYWRILFHHCDRMQFRCRRVLRRAELFKGSRLAVFERLEPHVRLTFLTLELDWGKPANSEWWGQNTVCHDTTTSNIYKYLWSNS